MALNITEPWFVKDLKFDVESKRLDIYIDFKKGSTFSFFDEQEDEELVGLKAYDTSNKTWKHLNFFEHECYLLCPDHRKEMPLGVQGYHELNIT